MSEKPRDRSPYQGLIPFDEGDAPFFFGREKETRLISANLFASALTLLYGASGVGKSSVLRAGVAHQLRQRDDVLVVVFNAWQREPINDLKAAIAAAAEAVEPGFVPPSLSLSLADYLNAYSNKLQRHVMIILDQFEEYFLYHAQDDSFADEFARALLKSEPPSSFLISIREDFYAKLDRFEGRIPSLYDNYFRVEHLDQTAARAALEKPIAEFNRIRGNGAPISLEPALVEAVLQQVQTGQVVLGESGRGSVATASSAGNGNEQIETPFLQLVMTRIWDEEMAEQSTTLRSATLKRLGGAESIVRTHLDAVMNARQPQDQDVASGIFHYLVTPSGTKIAYTASDLAQQAELDRSQVISVLEKLSHGELRILRPVDPPIDQPTERRYEIFHDVLGPAVLSWCAAFVQRKRRAAAEQRALEQEQRANEQARIATRLRRLVAALVVMFLLSLGAVGFAFAQRSQAKRNERVAQKYAQDSEDLRTEGKRLKAIGEAAQHQAMIERGHTKDAQDKADDAQQAADQSAAQAARDKSAALVATGVARSAQADAIATLNRLGIAQQETQTQKDIRRMNDQLAMATLSLHTNPQQSMWLAKEALEEAMKTPASAGPPTPAAEDALRRALLAMNESNVTAELGEHDNSIKSVAFSGDGRLAVTASIDQKAHVWDAQTGRKVSDLEGMNFTPAGASFNHDGTRLLIFGTYEVGYWNVQTGNRLALLKEPASEIGDDRIQSASFRAASDTILLIHKKSLFSVRIGSWNPEIVNAPPVEVRPRFSIPSAAAWLSPDGKLAMSAKDTAFQVWDTSTRETLASNVIRMYNSHTGATIRGDEVNEFQGYRTAIDTDERFPKFAPDMVAFSLDSGYVAYGSVKDDVTAILKLEKNTKTPNTTPDGLGRTATPAPPVPLEGFKGPLTCMSFSPDNRLLVTCSGTGNTRTWDVATGKNVADLPDHQEEVTNAVFSSDSRFVLEFITDGTIEIWSVETMSSVAVLRGHSGPVFSSSFSPDGKFLFTGGFDRIARIWKWQPESWRTIPVWRNEVAYSRNPAFSDDGKLVFAKSDSEAYVSKVEGNERLAFRSYASGFSREKKLVAAAANEIRTQVLDAETGEVQLRLNVDPDAVENLEFSKPGHFVLSSSSDGATRVFDARNGQTLVTLEGKNATFSPDEKLIATMDSSGGQVFNWRSDKGSEKPVRLKGSFLSDKTAFSPKGDLLVTGGLDRQARLWDTATGDLIAAFVSHRETIRSVAFSPDGKLILSTDVYGVQVCEVPRKGTQPADLKCLNLQGRTLPMYGAAFSPDSNYIVTAGARFVQVWLASATTERSLAVLYREGRSNQSAAFSPDGKHVASAGSHLLDVWTLPPLTNTEQIVETSVEYSADGSSFTDVTFSSDGKRVFGSTKDGNVHIWRWQEPKGEGSVRVLSGDLAVLSPDGQHVAITAQVGVLRVWDTKTWDSGPQHRVAEFEGFTNDLKEIVFSSDGRLVGAITNKEPRAFVWAVPTGKRAVDFNDGKFGSLESLTFSPDGKLLAVGGYEQVGIFETETGKLLRILQEPRELVMCIAFSPDGEFLISGTKGGTVRIWRVATGAQVALLRGHFYGIASVAFSPDGRFVATASFDQTARIWEWQNEAASRSPLILKGHIGAVVNAVFSPNGNFVLTSSLDRSARIWDARTGRLLAPLVGRIDASGGAEFSPDSKSIIVAGQEGSYVFTCRECGSAPGLLAEVDELKKARPLLAPGKQ